MQILGIIIIVVGLALCLAGRSLPHYMPPDYEDDDKAEIEGALIRTGKILSGVGIFFGVAGVILIIAGYVFAV